MNKDFEITSRVIDHYEESLNYFDQAHIVGCFLQGSQNYGLDIETSDVDTKLIIIPSFYDIAFNKQPVSTTHVRANDEHIDFKDIRLYMQTFRKQNLNFLEILFTDYLVLADEYTEAWQMLVDNREKIARYDQKAAMKSMRGIAKEKYFAMEHRYPSKIDIIDKYGYDPKQLHHLVRVSRFITDYIDGKPYNECLRPVTLADKLIAIKRGEYDLEAARTLANTTITYIDELVDDYLDKIKDYKPDEEVDQLLDSVQYIIMKKAMTYELCL